MKTHYEIAGKIRTIIGCDHTLAIKRWLHMEWLKENNITCKEAARKSLQHVNFDMLALKYNFKAL
jgi:hypothetical protein